MEASIEQVIREMHGNISGLVVEVRGVKEQTLKTNGLVAELQVQSLHLQGALSVVRFMLAFMLAGMSAGAGLAGVILAVVA